ncbi:MAG TPA: hypothetical protein VHW71_18120 [Steroidobacteraceae bacterium]|jgi:hypothetical protein|nr:hypothetical protein [Steroidobacteraceae bacterium]
MTVTDAAGDFLSYQVNLVSLQLQKADGTMVETLPATTAVDFAQLIDLSEVLSARQIPPGDYVAAQVTVDYTNASIMIDDGSGNAVAVKPVDATGAALGQLQLMVQLDNKNQLQINAAKTSRIAFDFNLLASNMVDLTAKTVTVSPVLTASVVPVDNKQVRVRGEITAVDTANSDYTVQVDPFHDRNDDRLSPLTVHVTGTTTFEINGTPLAGAAGLAQLATLPSGTTAVAFGSIDATALSFTASNVLAGSSVEGGGLDHLSGTVIARTGNSLTVHGAHMQDHDNGDDHDGNDEFMAGNSTVTIAAATAVTVLGQSSATPAHTIAEISVGSLIDAFGSASKGGSGPATFDASTGRVRLGFSQVQGVLNAVGTNQITIKLNSIDRLPSSLFSFAGTSSASGAAGDPTQYVLTTGNLSLTPFTVGESLMGIGLVAPFGSTPPDFDAITLVSGSQGDIDDDDDDNDNSGKGAQMDIDWGKSGTTVPFKALDAMHLDLDVSNSSIGSHHRIQVDPQDIDITALASDPSIVSASGMTQFAITGQHGRATDNFTGFADFEAALAQDLNGTTTALRLTADGQYDAASNTFSARRITILLSN